MCPGFSVVLDVLTVDVFSSLAGTKKGYTRGDDITSSACVYIAQAEEAFHSPESISRSRPEIIGLDL